MRRLGLWYGVAILSGVMLTGCEEKLNTETIPSGAVPPPPMPAGTSTDMKAQMKAAKAAKPGITAPPTVPDK